MRQKFHFIVSLMQITSCIRMEKAFKGQEEDSPVVFEVDGEPAVVINGLPKKMSCSKERVNFDATCDMQQADDPVFGELLEGRKVKKMFGGQYYYGEVLKYDPEVNWYRVVYEDGDCEDLEWHELEEVLLPLDINIPLKLLPFQSFLHDKSVFESKITMPITKSSHPMMVNSSELRQISEQTYEVPVQIDYKAERNWGDITMQTNLKTEKNFQKVLQKQDIILSGSVKHLHKPEGNSVVSKDYQNTESNTNMLELFQKPMERKDHGSSKVNMNEDANRTEVWVKHKMILKPTMKTAKSKKHGE